MSASRDDSRVSVPSSVMSASEFQARVDAELELLGVIEPVSPEADRPQLTEPSTRAAELRANRLHLLWHTVVQPPLVQRSTPRGRVAYFVKRVVRRLTSWYVEPRWAAQHEIDAEAARFATDAAAVLAALEARVSQLEEHNQALQRRLRESARRSGGAPG